MYQTGSRCDFKQIQRLLDNDLIENLGKDNVGRQWSHFSTQQKLEFACEVLKDSTQMSRRV
jgi:hypothetical protein